MFSVIAPTYNRPKTLQSLIHSLESQSFPLNQFEVIVVYSQGDTSEMLLKSYQGPLHLIALLIDDPIHNGRSASLKRNRGAERAQHQWLAFIDDDCIADSSWLANAQKVIYDRNPSAIEGLTQIPPTAKPTFTGRGLQNLSRFGGYQTCNMFYNKADFDSVGGFDPHLPFYLEDTDLAWSILEKNKSIVPAGDVIVTHPVPPSNVYRWIENAIRARKIPYLAKKHPELFKKKNFRALSRSSRLMGFVFLILLILLPFSLIAFGLGLFAYLILSWMYVFYLLRDSHYTFKEASSMLLSYPLVPPIAAIQLLRGNLEHRIFIL